MDEEPPTLWADRAMFYRCRALDALKNAGLAKEAHQRDQYFQMAQSWYTLALQIEDQIDRLGAGRRAPTLIPLKGATRMSARF